MYRYLGKGSEKGRANNIKVRCTPHGAHLTTDGTTLPAREREDFDMVCGELEQYPHSVVEVVGSSNVISYDKENVVLGEME